MTSQKALEKIAQLCDDIPAGAENVSATPQVTEQAKRLVNCILEESLSVKEILEKINLKHRPTLMNDYLNPAIENGFVEMTQPNSPKSPTQKYRLTQKGLDFKKIMEK